MPRITRSNTVSSSAMPTSAGVRRGFGRVRRACSATSAAGMSSKSAVAEHSAAGGSPVRVPDPWRSTCRMASCSRRCGWAGPPGSRCRWPRRMPSACRFGMKASTWPVRRMAPCRSSPTRQRSCPRWLGCCGRVGDGCSRRPTRSAGASATIPGRTAWSSSRRTSTGGPTSSRTTTGGRHTSSTTAPSATASGRSSRPA